MTTYQAAIGFGNEAVLEDLALQPLDPLDLHDPRTPSNTPGRIQTLLDGHRQADGYRRAALIYDPYLTTTRMRAVLEQLGLRDDVTGVEIESSEITIRLPGQDREWETWNAIAYHPHSNFERGRFAATTFDLILKEQLA
jgi:hypothetical protein